jgi:hypothetical protein
MQFYFYIFLFLSALLYRKCKHNIFPRLGWRVRRTVKRQITNLTSILLALTSMLQALTSMLLALTSMLLTLTSDLLMS